METASRPAGWANRAAALLVLVCCLWGAAAVTNSVAGSDAASPPDIEVFVREGCPHCAAAKLFLNNLQQERPALRLVIRDVAQDPHARTRMNELGNLTGTRISSVPVFYIRGTLLVGFAGADTTGRQLRTLLDQPSPSRAEPDSIETRWFGRLSVQDVGLPAFTLALGLLDGFNPCSMWVLLFMLSMLATLQDRLKMLLIAGTFIAVEGLAYFVFMAAWLNAFLFVGLSRPTEVFLGSIAVLAGAVNVKDFWAFHRGITLGIPESAKPGLYARIRAILHAEDLTAALAATVVLAVLVQAVEFLCTAGFPALYTRILTMRQLDWWAYYGYLGLYNAAYMFDDALVLAVGVVTLSRARLQEREGRWLKLIGGLVMLGLGLVLLARPQWLL